eukprot:3461178-Rhodomonas_salina.3
MSGIHVGYATPLRICDVRYCDRLCRYDRPTRSNARWRARSRKLTSTPNRCKPFAPFAPFVLLFAVPTLMFAEAMPVPYLVANAAVCSVSAAVYGREAAVFGAMCGSAAIICGVDTAKSIPESAVLFPLFWLRDPNPKFNAQRTLTRCDAFLLRNMSAAQLGPGPCLRVFDFGVSVMSGTGAPGPMRCPVLACCTARRRPMRCPVLTCRT